VPAALGMGIQAVLVSYGVFGVLQGLWLVRELRVLYAGTRKVPAPVTFGQTLRFALPLGATDIVGQLTQRFDRYLVAASFTALMFAEYHVGAFQIPILTTIAYSVGTAYAPTFTDLLREGKSREAIGLWRGTISKTSLVVVPLSLVFAIAADGLIELLFTKSYSQAASVFRFYALATAGRVAAFGAVIVAAGKPRLLLRAAVATLLLQAALSTLGLWLFGFAGPAIGACVAFVPTVVVYCYYIANATGLRLREIFPGAAYFKVVAVAAVAAVPAIWFERRMHLPPGLEVLGVAVIVLSLFMVLGRLSGVVSAADLAFVKERLRLQRKRG
jgi:O-antigen/teichoic acid export membrane protein